MRKDLQTAVPMHASTSDADKADDTRNRKSNAKTATKSAKKVACASSKLATVLLLRQFKQLSAEPPDGINVWLEVQQNM